MGRRIAKHTAQGETRFQYDGPRLLAETDSQRSRTYLFEPGSFPPLALHEQDHTQAGGNTYHYHLDHLGTPRELTDSQGCIVYSVRYRAYGTWLWRTSRRSITLCAFKASLDGFLNQQVLSCGR
ncbi:MULTISPECIES: RHS domain-containing protein [Methylomonas]|uniref:RHS protein conserved region domain-containing protein n=2 Tax=Methylomonas TaxID=416 RepID=A0A126T5E0_9GAMM|nr:MULTISPECIES: RHS domain-containing protein [Methylomonas]AMK77303.1 hypothetical protein JT25_012585 [Methylomonas denitrificans]OAH97803.1 hypothetical protein A1342_15385 [Methylomonas methanica]TCV77527.1 YD repeat-containing protein [Methylomonas methanica]